MQSNRANPIETANKPPFIMAKLIWLLTAAVKSRKAGLIVLLALFTINCYFMLLDQQNYIVFLEHYLAPDGQISDINNVFFKVQISIALIFIFLYLIDQASIELISKRSTLSKNSIHSRYSPFPYITACIFWLLISYLPFLLLEPQTIINLIKEDGFYQNFGAAFLFISSIFFFHLFYRKKRARHSNRRNIWFLLLGLLFLLGAGEEISWGQRIFNFSTPEFMSSNIQNEFTLHNLPWFDERSEKPFYNDNGVFVSNPKTGFIEKKLTTSSLMYFFCILTLIILPILTSVNSKMRKFCISTQLPTAPVFFGLIFLTENLLNDKIQLIYQSNHIHAIQNMAWTIAEEMHMLVWATGEIHETFISFLFMTLGGWFTLNAPLKKLKTNTKQIYN